ncbi:hypothetical protein PENCOP_c002G00415 [Penicillium coprophilum]|uniref:Uncharacterized protein n=1 Tax=Penicillium coprophilum TaxID=36646 RepID=A0A1V6V1F4_9EURO|nr:hypothetical protein PENCOP_c002G00415 [Penicillium coprophilum]
MSSTTWLCRDLIDHGFRTLKICIRDQQPVHEIAVSYHLKNASNHFGNWNGSIPIPKQSLEMRAQLYYGDDKELFLGFLRRVLCWLPKIRPSVEDIADDELLMQAVRKV